MKSELKKLPKSEVEIAFELDEKEFQKFFDKALEHLKDHVKMDGFRPGTVPKDIVEKKIGAENVLMEAGDLAVKDSYTKFVNENDLEPVSQPDVQIKKIAKGSPFEFTVKVSVLPEITLPDYKAIVKEVKVQDIAVDDKEIEEALGYLQRSRAKFIDKETPAELKDYVKISYQNDSINGGKETKDMFILGQGEFLKDFEDQLVGMKKGDEKTFKAKFPDNAPKELAGKEGEFKVKMLVVQIMELPEINDEFAKGLGVFDSLVALKTNLKEGITAEKQEAEKQRKRGEVLDKIAAKITFDLPEKMVGYEQKRLLENMKDQVAQQFKMEFSDYLATIKKTEEEVEKSYKVEAEKRIKDYLVLRQIGAAEGVEVTKEELEEEINRSIRNYSKDQLDKIDIVRLREYTKDAIFTEKVFKLIESF